MKKIWYESNAVWGNAETLEELKEKADLQISDSGNIYDVDEFLDKSTQIGSGDMNFGTRSEHTGKKTLREQLAEEGLVDKFCEMFGEMHLGYFEVAEGSGWKLSRNLEKMKGEWCFNMRMFKTPGLTQKELNEMPKPRYKAISEKYEQVFTDNRELMHDK